MTNSPPPTNEEGNTLSTDAYRLWKPTPIEDGTVGPKQFRAKLAELSRNLSMPQSKKSEREPKDELEELNEWLADPILREEVMARVMKGERYTVEFNEEGEAVQAVEG